VSRWIALGNGLFIMAMVSLPREVVGPTLGNAHFSVAVILNLYAPIPRPSPTPFFLLPALPHGA